MMGWQDDPVVQGKWESDPIIDPTPSTPSMLAAAPVMPVIELAAGGPAPQLLQPSANPYSAGFYPLGRKYTVGDRATFRETDLLTGVEKRVYTLHVTRVDLDADRVEINRGGIITDLMGNPIKQGDKEFNAPQQLIPAELQVGKKWTAAYILTKRGSASNAYLDLQIVRREKVSVPAGTFEAFRIEGQGWNKTVSTQLELTLWLVPGMNFSVKRESVKHDRRGRLIETERHELIALRQHAKGI